MRFFSNNFLMLVLSSGLFCAGTLPLKQPARPPPSSPRPSPPSSPRPSARPSRRPSPPRAGASGQAARRQSQDDAC